MLSHNNQQVQTTGYCTDVYFDYAIKFIDAAQSATKPFFCYLATNAPHGPLHDVPEKNYSGYAYNSQGVNTIRINTRDRALSQIE